MKKTIFILWGMLVGLGVSVRAEVCRVERPDQLLDAVQKLLRSDCDRLQFVRTMDIYLDAPLVLEGGAGAMEIAANPEEVTVRLIGTFEAGPGLRIKRDDVILHGLILRDFPGDTVQIEADGILLENLEIAHSGGRGVSVRRGRDVLIRDSKIHHSQGAALFWRSSSRVMVERISLQDNGGGIEIEGPGLSAPVIFEAIPLDAGRFLVAGTVPLSEGESPLGTVRPSDLAVDIYRADVGSPAQGREWLGRIEELSEEGDFHGEFSIARSSGFLTALAVHKGMGMVSAFSDAVLIAAPAAETETAEGEDGRTEETESAGDVAAEEPVRIDTDRDGLFDDEEDLNQNGWLDPDETDPNNPDTDGDGLPDGREGLGDDDGDGFINARDRDSDNNGCPDGQDWICERIGQRPAPTQSPSQAPPAVAQDKSEEEVALPSEVLPSRGGGACHLARKNGLGRDRTVEVLAVLFLWLGLLGWRSGYSRHSPANR